MAEPKILDLHGIAPEIATLVLENAGGGSQFNLILRSLTGTQTFAIPDEDFPVVQTAFELVGSFFAGSYVTWAPGAVANLIMLLIEFRRKRVELNALQAAILEELKQNPGAGVEDLVELIHVKSIDGQAIEAQLNKLTSLPNMSGVLTQLVSTDGKGHWFVNGV